MNRDTTISSQVTQLALNQHRLGRCSAVNFKAQRHLLIQFRGVYCPKVNTAYLKPIYFLPQHVCHSQVMMYLLHYGREVNAKEEAHNVASPTNAF